MCPVADPWAARCGRRGAAVSPWATASRARVHSWIWDWYRPSRRNTAALLPCGAASYSATTLARYRRAVTAKGHFPTQQAALKTLYLVTRGLDPKGTGQARWTMRWKPALNAFAVTFVDRMPAAENL